MVARVAQTECSVTRVPRRRISMVRRCHGWSIARGLRPEPRSRGERSCSPFPSPFHLWFDRTLGCRRVERQWGARRGSDWWRTIPKDCPRHTAMCVSQPAVAGAGRCKSGSGEGSPTSANLHVACQQVEVERGLSGPLRTVLPGGGGASPVPALRTGRGAFRSGCRPAWRSAMT
jgi:hypothetical protein